MKKRLSVVTAAIVAVVLGVAGIAYATPGDDAGSGSLTIHNVQTQDATYTGPTSRTVTVDCPSGEVVLTGFGSLVNATAQASNIIPGSKLDVDSWTVTFTLDVSTRYVLLVSASCLEV